MTDDRYTGGAILRAAASDTAWSALLGIFAAYQWAHGSLLFWPFALVTLAMLAVCGYSLTIRNQVRRLRNEQEKVR
jgi:hypothetical protein